MEKSKMEFFPATMSASSSDDESDQNSSKPSRGFSQLPKKRKYEPETSSSSPNKSNGSPKKCKTTINTSNSLTSPAGNSKRKPKDGFSSDEDRKPSFSSISKKNKYETATSSATSLSGDDSEDSSTFSPPSSMPSIANQTSVIKSTSSKQPIYNKKATDMMAKMGFKEGMGLGKAGQGRVEIVEMSKQRGRRGLGLQLKGLEPRDDIEWDPTKEEILVAPKVEWMPECNLKPPLITEMRKWTKEGPEKKTIDDEIEFCDPQILHDVISCKSVFDNLEPDELRKARTKSNPFETIQKAFFQNRAALKMAEMDAIFDFMFTSPKDENDKPLVKPSELLYFADICAGPGGFSEYVLWRKKWHAKGFGLTLKSMNDFKLEEFFAGSPETFEPHYGVGGFKGDGDIFKSDNLREFRRHVLDNTDAKPNCGVHFVMADGGFSVEGQENIQEILSKRLYLCQFLCALSILKTDGHFVCKLFDIFTTFSVGLIYLLYRAFKKICIFKPNTSRPANSERYVVCKWKRENVRDIHDYMYEVNCSFGTLSEDVDINEIVPIEILREDTAFYQYIVDSNNDLGQKQVVGLDKIRKFAQNIDLIEEKQSDLRKDCLELWKIPDKIRSAPPRVEPAAKVAELLQSDATTILNHDIDELTESKLTKIDSIYDYRCVVSGIEKNRCDRNFILGLGRQQIFKREGRSWVKCENLNLELPAGTLLFAEIVPELKGESRAQKKIFALHIVDVLFIGGDNMSNLFFTERLKQAAKLVKAVSKPTRVEQSPIKVKEIYKLEEVERIFERLEMKSIKGSQNNFRLCYKMDDGRHFLPTGMYLIKVILDPWCLAMSKNRNLKYYFNKTTKDSKYDCPKGSIASFKSTFASMIFWSWELGVKLLDNHDAAKNRIHRNTIVDFVKKKLTGSSKN